MKKSLLGRIILLVLISFLVLFGLTYWSVGNVFKNIREQARELNYTFLIEDRKTSLEYHSNIVSSMVEGYLQAADKAEADFEEKLWYVRKLIRDASFGDNGYFFMYDFEGLRLSYRPAPDTELETNLFDLKDEQGNLLVQDMIEIAQKGGGYTTYYWENPATGNVEPKIGYYAPLSIDGYEMFFGVGTYVNDIDERNKSFIDVLSTVMDHFKITFILTQLLLTAVTLILLSFILRRKLNPLKTITDSITVIASGDADLTARIDIKTADEIGTVALRFNEFTASLQELIRETQGAVAQTVSLESSLSESTSSTSSSIEQINRNIMEVQKQLELLNDNIRSSVTATEQITANVGSFDSQIENQAQMVEESTAAITEMISSLESVDGITKNKKEAVGLLSAMVEEGQNSLSDTRAHFTSVVAKIDSINEMTDIINNIASQTNLLSMNAAIEAAHAGDAGKGFAVVAEEIRKLADSTSASSSNIARHVQEIGEGIRITNDNIIGFDSSYKKIGEEIQSTVQAFQEIEYSISELNSGGSQILRASQEINNATSSIRSGSAEIKAGIHTMMESADRQRSISGEVSGELQKISGESVDIRASIGEVVDINGKLGRIVELLKTEFGKFRT